MIDKLETWRCPKCQLRMAHEDSAVLGRYVVEHRFAHILGESGYEALPEGVADLADAVDKALRREGDR